MKTPYDTKTVMLMQLYFSRLSERERRQYAAVESLKLGWGGISYISEIFAIDRKTIRQGRAELAASEDSLLPPIRQRKNGGGRKKNGKNSGDKDPSANIY